MNCRRVTLYTAVRVHREQRAMTLAFHKLDTVQLANRVTPGLCVLAVKADQTTARQPDMFSLTLSHSLSPALRYRRASRNATQRRDEVTRLAERSAHAACMKAIFSA